MNFISLLGSVPNFFLTTASLKVPYFIYFFVETFYLFRVMDLFKLLYGLLPNIIWTIVKNFHFLLSIII